MHADLGRAEWQSTPATVEATARHLGVPLTVVRRAAGDLVTRWETRFDHGKARYVRLETYHLIGPWSSAKLRYSTAEMKAQVIGPAVAKRHAGEVVIQVIGVRRQESRGRAGTPVSIPDHRHAPLRNRRGTRMVLWHPGVEATEAEVFAAHARHGIPLHEAYTAFRSSRLGCAYCVLASEQNLAAASACPGNHGLFLHLCDLERSSTFSFQPQR